MITDMTIEGETDYFMRKARQLTGGAGIADITPPVGTQMVGYPYIPRHSTGVHDPLFATCLALDDGMTKIILIHADLCYFEKKYAGEIRSSIASKLSLKTASILLSCSHTHSGPRMATRLTAEDKAFGFQVESAYLEKLRQVLVDLAVQTAAQQKNLLIGFGRGHAGSEKGIGGNRNTPGGISDPSLGVIGIKDADAPDGEWMAVWVRYSLHPSILQTDNTLISADYPGFMRAHIQERFPHAIMMFAQGATGDQSSRFFRKSQTFDEAERFGREIGQEACRVLTAMQTAGSIRIAAASEEVEPVWRDLPTLDEINREVDELRQKCQALERAGAAYAPLQTCRLDLLGAEYTRTFLQERALRKKHPWDDEQPLEIQVFTIGDCCVAALQGEIFVRYTLEITANSPFCQTEVVTLANGLSPGYVVSEEAAGMKVYEAGTTLVKPETGARMVETAARLCHELYNR